MTKKRPYSPDTRHPPDTPRLRALLAAATLCSAACLPMAAGAQGLSLRAGVGEHYGRAELAWESAPLWSHELTGGNNRLELVGELSAAYWLARGGRSPENIWQFSAIPFVRWSVNNRVYLEAGVGPTLFSATTFANTEISTAFQFGSHIGVGIRLSNHDRLSIRLSHFSNADIKKPNPGLNILQVGYTHLY